MPAPLSPLHAISPTQWLHSRPESPQNDSDHLRQALVDSMQRNVEVDEPEVVAAPMLPPTMRVTLGSRSGEL